MANWTQADLDALNAAIGQGVKEVEYGDKTVEYRSLSEMLQIRDLMMQCLGLKKKGGTRIFTKFNKGLD